LSAIEGKTGSGGSCATVPLGEDGRNELRVTADEEAHLLFCPQADDGGTGPGAEFAGAGGRKRDPGGADADTESTDRRHDFNEEGGAAVVLDAVGAAERGAGDVWAGEDGRAGAGDGE